MNIKTIQINEKKGAVTVVTHHPEVKPVTVKASDGREILVGIKVEDVDTVTVSRTCEGDTFDPEIGLALALAYQMFGSKTQFKKAVKKLLKK